MDLEFSGVIIKDAKLDCHLPGKGEVLNLHYGHLSPKTLVPTKGGASKNLQHSAVALVVLASLASLSLPHR